MEMSIVDLKNLIFELCSARGPSGEEGGAAEVISRRLSGLADDIKTDRAGNLTAFRRCAAPGAKTLLLDAHIDQVSMVTTEVTPEGFLRFIAPGLDARLLPAREVTVLGKEPLFGVVACLPPHILSAEDAEKVPEPSSLFIDVGLSEERAEKLAPAGTRVIFSSECAELSGESLLCPALDNRAGAAALIYALKLLKGRELTVNLALLFSAKEESGLLGAPVGAYSANPDFCLVIDATHAKTPDSSADESFESGGGPHIGVGPNLNRGFTDMLIRIAEEKKIKYGLEVMEGNTGTNAWPIQISREGVATALVSFPVKYMHSPHEASKLCDIFDTARLAAEFVASLGRGGAF
jgi:endoglucanase